MGCRAFVLFLPVVLAGCGTTRSTDTARAATEMLLVSQSIDRAVGLMDFTPLAGRTVYLSDEYVDKAIVDRGYLVSSVRQQLLAAGVLLRADPKEAIYIVELRAGGLGTDRHSVLVGTPAMSLPAVVPGVPTNIPELALYKKSDQKGVAKIGAFAFNRVTGRAVWQSGLVEQTSTLKDRWFLGSGPYTDGSIRPRTEFAGEELPDLPRLPFTGSEPDRHNQPVTPAGGATPERGHQWTDGDSPPPAQPLPEAVRALTGAAAVVGHPLVR